MSSTRAAGGVVRSAEGEKLSFMGMDLIWKVTSEMSGGTLLEFVQVAPQGTGVPLHIHHNEAESIYVISGELRFRLGDEEFDAATGDVILMPKGVPHAFRITSEEPAHVLFTLDLSPESDYERMFEGLVGLRPEDFDRVREVAAENDVEFVAPPQMP